MKALIVLALLATTATTVVAQDKPKEEPKQEKLSQTEVIALNYVMDELRKAQQDAANVVVDIQKAHPGYTFNFQTGQLDKLPTKETEKK